MLGVAVGWSAVGWTASVAVGLGLGKMEEQATILSPRSTGRSTSGTGRWENFLAGPALMVGSISSVGLCECKRARSVVWVGRRFWFVFMCSPMDRFTRILCKVGLEPKS